MAVDLSVVIPCYNEQATLPAVVRRVLAAPPQDKSREVVVVDDGSSDGSREIAEELARQYHEVKTLSHESNRGKGAALRTAQAHCSGDVVIIQDADLEYKPDNYPELIHPITSGKADVVYGSRFAGGRCRRVLLFWHEVGNRFLTLLSNMTTNLNLTDMETCYKVFKGEYFRAIPIKSNTFCFEPEITAKVAKLGLRVYEVPVDYHGRDYDAGKKIGWVDGVKAIFAVLRFWLFDGLPAEMPAEEELSNMGRGMLKCRKWA